MKLIKQFDLFGPSFTFEEDKSSIFNTSLGTFLSYSVLITIIILGFVLENEIYSRKNPSLMSGEEIDGRADTEVPLKEFPIIMNMVGNYGASILKDYRSIFNVNIMYTNTASDGKISAESFYDFSDC